MSLRALRAASARLGADRLLIQGAGGNTSIKLGDVMWIKASGTELAEAQVREIFVPVAWGPYRRALLASPHPTAEAADFTQDSALRPSIETPLHAVFTDPVVLHVHCVRSLALAVRRDAKRSLAARLDGHARWHFVPYARPGLPLLPGILKGIARAAEVFVLGNHGLIVVGESVDSALGLLHATTARLHQTPRAVPAVDSRALGHLAGEFSYAPAPVVVSAGLIAHPEAARILQGGPLYPDHVVFLGAGPQWCESEDAARAAMQQGHKAVVLAGRGALVHTEASMGARAMLACLADVLVRLPDAVDLRHLSAAECAALTHWEAEKYRQNLGA